MDFEKSSDKDAFWDLSSLVPPRPKKAVLPTVQRDTQTVEITQSAPCDKGYHLQDYILTEHYVRPQKEEKKPEPKAEPKAEVKATPKPEKKTAPKAKAAPKAEPKLEPKPEPAPEVKEATAAPEQSTSYTGKFEINKSKDGKKYFFNLYASNKVGIATSQMYSSAQSALNGIKSVIANAPTAPVEDQSLKNYEELPYPKWEIYVDNGGKFRFRLNASNGNCVCHSQGYTTKNACKNGIDSIIRSSKNAEIDKTYISKKDEK